MYFISVFVFFPLYSFAGWTVFHQTSERVTYKSSSKPRTRFLSGPVSLSICLYLFFCILSQPIFLLPPFSNSMFCISNMFGRMPLFLNHLFFLFIFLLSNHHEHTLFNFSYESFFCTAFGSCLGTKSMCGRSHHLLYSLMVNSTLDLSKLLYFM